MTRLLPAVIVAALLAGACSAEATATSGDPPETRSTSADQSLAFYEKAEDILGDLEASNPSVDGYRRGVIVSENKDGWDSDWVVTTTSGTVLLEPAVNCVDDSDSTGERDLWQLIDPGDLIAWSTSGGDTRICTGEVDVVEKGAVPAEPAR